MSFSVGIVGLPNVGKSTLFRALTKKQVDTSNYPFCTIDPNVGVVSVPDKRLESLAKISKSEKVIPTTIEFVDIAGLVKNAHKGEGLGNQFLSHIREVDAIVQVARDFHDPNVAHVEGKIDPKNDIEIINLELIMADLSTVSKRLGNIEGEARSGNKEAQQLLNVYSKIKNALDEGLPASRVKLAEEEKKLVKDLGLLTLKPMLYILNIDESNINGETTLPASMSTLSNLVQPCPTLSNFIPLSAKLESELAELAETEAQEYMRELGLKQSGLDCLTVASYKLLNLITYFTSGPKETRAWTITQGTRAQEAAGKIHTDFEKGFIKAEIINWKNLVDAGGEFPAKEKGLMHLEGKDYLVQDGDVCLFHFSK